MIDVTHYSKWTDVIDKIISSSFIISESLHGLIISEAYEIPCVWAEFIDHSDKFNTDWKFKFLDFYESIEKFNMHSQKLYNGFDFEELLKFKDSWRSGKIDYKKLLSYFPFEVKRDCKLPA